VFLGDDIMDHTEPSIAQLMRIWEQHQGPVVAVQEVPRELTSSYGIIKPRILGPGLFEVTDLVEKPAPDQAPSNLGIVGRYLLTPDIFAILEQTRSGRGGEIQLTDALRQLRKLRPLYACALQGVRHDIGNKVEFVKATLDYALKDPKARGPLLGFMRDLVAKER